MQCASFLRFNLFLARFSYPDLYTVLAVTNPLVDLSAFSANSDVPDLAWQLVGMNFTVKSLPVEIGELAWQK
jgi:hypothetical protein